MEKIELSKAPQVLKIDYDEDQSLSGDDLSDVELGATGLDPDFYSGKFFNLTSWILTIIIHCQQFPAFKSCLQ